MPAQRSLKQLARQRDVPCAQCGVAISAARASLAIAHGRCAECNAPFLKTSQEARDRAPEYETKVWERGGRL